MTATKKQLAAWSDLKDRRTRTETGCFLAEGRKVVAEIREAGWPIEALLTLQGSSPEVGEVYQVTEEQMARVSGFRSPPEVLAVVRQPLVPPPTWQTGQLVFLLDDVQDPGNVGTIIRTAGWFGFDAVVCSPGCADPWQPKVVQATMGAFLRVHLRVTDPLAYLETLPREVPILGTFLDGESLLGAQLPQEGVVILGNEGRGISPGLSGRVGRRLTIPRFGRGGESLNVAAVSALMGAEFRRRID